MSFMTGRPGAAALTGRRDGAATAAPAAHGSFEAAGLAPHSHAHLHSTSFVPAALDESHAAAGRAPSAAPFLAPTPGAPLESGFPPATATGGALPAARLFDSTVTATVRLMDREEVTQPLGISVTATRTAIAVRVTDPRDPFFLFTMSLHADEYGRFKEEHELNVDFGSFPRHLTTMLEGSAAPLPPAGGPPPFGGVAGDGHPHQPHAMDHTAASLHAAGVAAAGGGSPLSAAPHPPGTPSAAGTRTGSAAPIATAPGASPYVVEFVSRDHAVGTLRVLERGAFRAVEFIALRLARQGDDGQKRYLAEQFRHYRDAFHAAEQGRAAEAQRNAEVESELRGGLAAARAELAELHRTADVARATAHATQAEVAASLQKDHEAELRRQRGEFDADRRDRSRVHDEEAAAARVLMAEREAQLSTQREGRVAAEAALAAAAAEGRQRAARLEALEGEAQGLRAEVAELRAYRLDAERRATMTDIEIAKATERVRHLETSSADKDRERRDTAEQAALHKEHLAAVMVREREGQAALVQERDKTAKAHHIIQQQLSGLKAAKGRVDDLKGRLAAVEGLVAAKEREAERARSDAAAAEGQRRALEAGTERLERQLERTEADKAALATQLEENQAALIHIQRSASSTGTRRFAAATTAASTLGASRFGGGTGGFAGGHGVSFSGGPAVGSSSFTPASMAFGSGAGGLYTDFARGASLGAAGPAGGAPVTANLSTVGSPGGAAGAAGLANSVSPASRPGDTADPGAAGDEQAATLARAAAASLSPSGSATAKPPLSQYLGASGAKAPPAAPLASGLRPADEASAYF